MEKEIAKTLRWIMAQDVSNKQKLMAIEEYCERLSGEDIVGGSSEENHE